MTQPAGGLTVEDRLDIHQLIADYNYYEDNGDAEAWASLFTRDGGFTGSGKSAVMGRDRLVEFARRRWVEKPQVRNWVHWVGNVTIRATPEGAESQSYQMTIEDQGGAYRIVKLSGKVDDIRLEDGKWRFHMRRVTPLPPQPAPSAGAP